MLAIFSVTKEKQSNGYSGVLVPSFVLQFLLKMVSLDCQLVRNFALMFFHFVA